jgi:predicted HicB family RNase H-like nuclease
MKARVNGGIEGGRNMGTESEVWVQLATRIPKQLHRELKLHCVKADVSVMDFVVSALEDKLSREARGGQRRRARPS